MQLSQPYHEGERRVQERAGETEMADRNGRVIADSILGGALPFLAQQSMVVLGSLDASGDPWASALFGRRGFLAAPDDRTVRFDLAAATPNPDDPLWENIATDPRVGMLAIELASRRRLRINGALTRLSDDALSLAVAESYPNCPKYIQRRHMSWRELDGDRPARPSTDGTVLGVEQAAIVRGADTLFIASAHPERGVDASHRGGPTGFVQLLDERTLRLPDYAGNSMFNTLGNLEVHPPVGLLFLDFDGGRTLQLTGRAAIRWDEDDPRGETGGTGRFLEVAVQRWRLSGLPATVRWEFLDASPFLPRPSGEGPGTA